VFSCDVTIQKNIRFLLAVDRDLKEMCPSDCNPQVVLIFNLNDDSSCENSDASSVVSHPTHLSSAEPKNPPKLDAEKSKDFLLRVLLSMGFLVLLVVNKGKEYLSLLLKALKNVPAERGWSEPVPFLMLISSTHGICDSISMNGELFEIPELMKQLASINSLHIFALIESCQIGGHSLKITNIERPYSIVYSVPPECISQHCNGVGFLIRSLKEVLKNGYRKSVKEFVDDLRLKQKDLFRKVFKKDYEENGLVHVSVSGDANFSRLIEIARKNWCLCECCPSSVGLHFTNVFNLGCYL